MVRPVVLCLPFLTGCLQIGPSSDADAGAPAPGASSAPGDAAAVDDRMGGSNCALDSISGVTLCTSVAVCPGLAVDHDVYPDCGFRVPSSSIDLECVCGDFLCPIGAALGCGQAKDLLDSHSELDTCIQASDGRCAPRSAPKMGGSSCDHACADVCAGDPGCLQLCGC
jgi:hypothetical protein